MERVRVNNKNREKTTQIFRCFKRREFTTTEIELRAIAPEAKIGESKIPKNLISLIVSLIILVILVSLILGPSSFIEKINVLLKTLKKKVVRRQDAPAVYSMNASIYFYNRDYLLSADHPSPLSDDIEIYLMGENSSIDIDRELDFKFIEFLVKEGHVKL